MPLINFEITIFLTQPEEYILVTGTVNDQETNFAISDTKLYLPVVTLLAQDNAKLLQQLKTGIKRTINWSKYQSGLILHTENPYLNYLIELSFEGVNRLFYHLKMMHIEEVTSEIFFRLHK